MDFLASAVGAVIPSCIKSIWRNVSYSFNAEENMKALDKATETLVAMEADVKAEIESAHLQGLMQTNLVTDWIKHVEDVKIEAKEINKRCEERSPLLGKRSLNVWSNYWISKNAAKKLKVVQNLCDRKAQFQEVASQPPPQVKEIPIESVIMPKEEADLQTIIRYIDNDPDTVIGIWGMGGVGKTRLLQLVHNRYAQSSSFDTVIFVTASRECSVEKLQAELCNKYKFRRENDVASQAGIISQYLSNRNFLLLLDDLWDRIDLETVGIPLNNNKLNSFNRKVVITTRSERVCGMMEVKQSHKLTTLDFDDAYRLFVGKVGDDTLNSHPHISSLAQQVVRELDGLPLALITIGRAMYGKRDPREWEHAIDLLQRSCLHEIDLATRDDEKTYYRLKFSYDSLESEELKNCFLACSLWPEDYQIPKEELIECWMGLGLLQTFNGRNIYNSGYTLIGKLLPACLIESDDPDTVKMHDVIRDMAIWLVCDLGKQKDKWIVQMGGGVNQVLHEKVRWCDTECATILRPDGYMGELKSIPREAKRLCFLKVDLRFYHSNLTTLFDNLKFFSALTFLDLSHCKLKAFPPAVFHLVNLKYLNLSWNQIRHVPEELKHLENLMYLYLGYNDILSFPKGIISQLRELRILSLFRSSISKEEYHTWLIEELGCLNNIKSIEIQLQHPDQLESLLKLPFLPIRILEVNYFDEMDSLVIPSSFLANRAIQDNLYRVYIHGSSVQKVVIESLSQKSPCHLRNLEHLRFIDMPKLEMIIWSGVKPKDLFVKLQIISIYGCDKLNDASWLVHLPCLQFLHISSCFSMIQIFQRSNSASTSEIREELETPTFPSLKYLHLIDLPNLQVICDPSIKFHSLETLHVLYCPMLKNLPFHPDTIPCNLLSIHGSSEWWEQLEWEQNEHKTALQPFFKVDSSLGVVCEL